MTAPKTKQLATRKVRSLLLAGLGLWLVLGSGCASPEKDRIDPGQKEEQRHLAAYNYNLAERFWERNRLDLALRYLDLAVRRDPAASKARLKILDLYLVNGSPEAAIRYLEDCPPELAESAPFFNRRVLAFEMAGRKEEVTELLREAAECGPLDPELTVALAENRFLEGDRASAFALLEGELARKPGTALYLEQLAAFSEAIGRYDDQARYALELASLTWGEKQAMHLREAAKAYAWAGRAAEGIEAICTLRGHPCPPPEGVRQACVGMLQYEMGAYPDAVSSFERAFALKSFEPTDEELMVFSELRLREGHPGQAAELLKKELENDPSRTVVRAALAWAYYCNGDLDRCRRAIDEAPEPIPEESLLAEVKQRLEKDGYEN